MRAAIRFASAAILIQMISSATAAGAENRAFEVAAVSCTATYNTCVTRCRRDVPQDKACPADHCAPKLATCKASGCWQEGQRYGSKLTCNLTRS